MTSTELQDEITNKIYDSIENIDTATELTTLVYDMGEAIRNENSIAMQKLREELKISKESNDRAEKLIVEYDSASKKHSLERKKFAETMRDIACLRQLLNKGFSKLWKDNNVAIGQQYPNIDYNSIGLQYLPAQRLTRLLEDNGGIKYALAVINGYTGSKDVCEFYIKLNNAFHPATSNLKDCIKRIQQNLEDGFAPECVTKLGLTKEMLKKIEDELPA